MTLKNENGFTIFTVWLDVLLGHARTFNQETYFACHRMLAKCFAESHQGIKGFLACWWSFNYLQNPFALVVESFLIMHAMAHYTPLVFLYCTTCCKTPETESKTVQNKPTSTSFIIGTGLKKWRPPNRSSLVVELAISVMGRDDVLLAKIVCL